MHLMVSVLWLMLSPNRRFHGERPDDRIRAGRVGECRRGGHHAGAPDDRGGDCCRVGDRDREWAKPERRRRGRIKR